nr:DNA polymerase III subunit gamma/tau [Lachnospiraceae bacterium]
MAYIALYRKWRPTAFQDVKGQDAIVKTLQNQIAGNRIGHAYLFCGSRGTGKTTMAKIFAKAVNCENPQNGCACGVCETCRSIEEGRSTNVIEIDAASNNGVDNIREIRDEVQYRPATGKYRVYIIDEVHNISSAAFNAMLKTLEEPPEYVIFILATTEPHAIPVTVLSRCQRFDFHRITPADMVERLHELMAGEGIKAEEAALNYIARKADGAMRDAISLFDQSVSAMPGEVLRFEDVLKTLGTVNSAMLSRYFRAVLNGDIDGALALIGQLRDEGRDLGQFVVDFIWYLRNLLVLMTSEASAEELELSREDWIRLAEEGQMTGPEELMELIRLYSALGSDLKGTVDKRVLLEVGTIQAARPRTEESRDAAEARLTALERKVDRLQKNGVPAAAASPAAQTAPQPQAEEQSASPAAGKEVIKLSPAQWEDLQLIRSHWPELLSEMDYPSAQLLKRSRLEPLDGGVLRVVFPDIFTANMIKSFGALPRLEELVAAKYQKEIRFDLRTARKSEPEPVYITDEELSHIHMNIETDTED